jgi:multicomponent Na+:H+ antiporter subunit D
VPLTAGFVSKWALATALIDEGQGLVLAAMLVSSLLAVVYTGRIIEIGWFREPSGSTAAAGTTPVSMGVATWALVLASLYFGVDPRLPASLADAAASALLGPGGG